MKSQDELLTPGQVWNRKQDNSGFLGLESATLPPLYMEVLGNPIGTAKEPLKFKNVVQVKNVDESPKPAHYSVSLASFFLEERSACVGKHLAKASTHAVKSNGILFILCICFRGGPGIPGIEIYSSTGSTAYCQLMKYITCCILLLTPLHNQLPRPH